MKSLNQTRAPAVTLAAYMALIGSMAYAVAASAGQAADAHAQHNCVTEHAASDVATDAVAVALQPDVTLPVDQVDAQAAAQPAASAAKAKPSRRKNQVESSLFHF